LRNTEEEDGTSSEMASGMVPASSPLPPLQPELPQAVIFLE